MSLIFMDSFDDGLSAQKWTAFVGAQTSIGGIPRTGTSAANLSTGTGSDQEGASLHRAFVTADQHATYIVGMGLYQENLPFATAGFLQLYPGPSLGQAPHLTFRREDDGSISVYRGGTGTIGTIPSGGTTGGTLLATSAPNVILMDQYYHVEIKAFVDDAAGTVEVRVNNTTVLSFLGDTRNGSTALFGGVIIGFANDTDGNAAGVYIDDFYVLNGAGAINNNFIGDSRIHSILPDANGNYSELVGSDGNSVDNYLQVDENPPNTTDYNGGGTSGDQDSYNFPSLPAAVTAIRGVAQRAWAASSDTGTRAARNFVRISGVDYNGADYNVGQAYLMYETLFNVSPATGVAFTVAEFNGAEWGFEVRA